MKNHTFFINTVLKEAIEWQQRIRATGRQKITHARRAKASSGS